MSNNQQQMELEYSNSFNKSSVSWDGRDFSGLNFSGKDLRKFSLEGTNFRGAILSGANLSGVNAMHSDFYNANLVGAILNGTNFYLSDMRNARFIDADLRNADLRNADVCDANFEDANMYKTKVEGAEKSHSKQFSVAFKKAHDPKFDGPKNSKRKSPGPKAGYETINGEQYKNCPVGSTRNSQTMRCNKNVKKSPGPKRKSPGPKRKSPGSKAGYETINGKQYKKCPVGSTRNLQTMRCRKN
jgi:hypothetical protein